MCSLFNRKQQEKHKNYIRHRLDKIVCMFLFMNLLFRVKLVKNTHTQFFRELSFPVTWDDVGTVFIYIHQSINIICIRFFSLSVSICLLPTLSFTPIAFQFQFILFHTPKDVTFSMYSCKLNRQRNVKSIVLRYHRKLIVPWELLLRISSIYFLFNDIAKRLWYFICCILYQQLEPRLRRIHNIDFI